MSSFSTLYLQSMLLMCSSLCLLPAMSFAAHNNFTDLSALLSFKAHVGNPYVLSANWTTNVSFCGWVGVACSRRRQRVIALDLHGLSLQGTITPHLANLSFLNYLNLENNTLRGSIPDPIGQLPRLKTLNLSRNHLSGSIPSTLFNMSSLTAISLLFNNLSGSLPTNHSGAMLPRLKFLSLSANQLSGNIPSSLVGCLHLRTLSLSVNKFTGYIPQEIGNLPELRFLTLGGNLLTGTIPLTLGNLTKVEILDLSNNHLHGEIPLEFGCLLNLQELLLSVNRLDGRIPISLSNASLLRVIDLTFNNLSGPVHVEFENMPYLSILNLGGNMLTGGLDFLISLSPCSVLDTVHLSYNEFDGVLPDSIGNLSRNLLYFEANTNHMKGKIPVGLGNLSSLLSLDLSYNELTGSVPSPITRLDSLEVLYLGGNRIDGYIPTGIGQLSSLIELGLEANTLHGSIPDSVGNISGLQHLLLAGNTLSSAIPESIWKITGLVELYLAQNSLDGSFPPLVGNLKTLDLLDISMNQLSGKIPIALGGLQLLSYLDLSNNSFDGNIPESFGGLFNIEVLNLSCNFLSGAIPNSLSDLRYLKNINLSFNRLEGKIPEKRVFSNLTLSSLMGNAALCGAPRLGFPPCPTNVAVSNSRRRVHLLKYILLPATVGTVILVASCCLLFISRRYERTPTSAPTNTQSLADHKMISYHELVRATDNFCEANLLGRGSFGSVFRGRLDDGSVTAIKVLDIEVKGALRSFEAECRALGMIRHRNIVKVISTCSNLDFKALVLQFMPNGSLERWLYSHNYYLNFLQRINIMLDVASALEYLHHDHSHVVVHCDLKPSNVLLDENMTAHVGDFGIAKLWLGHSKSMESTNVRGTFGYIAPEYASTGRVSRTADVYSFGILLLETFTRKKPNDAIFDGKLNLRQWVCEACPTGVLDVVDGNLLKDQSGNGWLAENKNATHQCLSSILDLGLLCSRDSAKERILMKEVTAKLQKIKMEFSSEFSSA